MTAVGQDKKDEAESGKTKMEMFSSKTGVIVKFIDTELPVLNTLYASGVQNRIRKVKNGSVETYFYQIVNKKSTASIEYSDLIEVIKAIKTLKNEVVVDVASNDYIENKFTTSDGFQLGYFISKGKASWYIRLEKYGSDNSLFFNDAETIENAFEIAKKKIDELKVK